MRILTGKKWREGFLDYHQNKSDYRIQVLAWQNLERLENVYHTRPKSLRLLVNYFPVVGPEGMFTKVWSRIREERRNEKYVSCGVGKIIKSAADRAFTEGETVGFIAPLHPAMVERVTLPEKLIFKIEKSDIPELPKEKILYFPIQNKESRNGWWQDIRGWSIYSGIKISKETRNALANGLKKWLKETEWTEPEKIDARNATPITEIKGKIKKINPNKKSGVLFGYGNYAKINIIPYMKPFVDIQAVHEIDPTQIFREQGDQKWDAAPFRRKDKKYDV